MRSAVIIGAGPGIGAAVARRFAHEGYAIGLVARTLETIGATRATLGDAWTAAAVADSADDVELHAALDEIATQLGSIDVLVYNAAVIRRDLPGELGAAELGASFAVNVGGAVAAAAFVAPLMAVAGSGTILFTSGMPEPVPEYFSLSLGKAGLRAVTAMFDEQYRDHGIHVAAVTVYGEVMPGGAFDPDDIAEHYWQLHAQPPGEWQREVRYRGRRPMRAA